MQDFLFLEKGGHRMEMIKEGDLYKRIEIEGVTFLIYYGYSTEKEKEHGWEPAPQYPAFEDIFKCGPVDFTECTFVYFARLAISVILAVVCAKMLYARTDTTGLHTFDKRFSKYSRQIRIFG